MPTDDRDLTANMLHRHSCLRAGAAAGTRMLAFLVVLLTLSNCSKIISATYDSPITDTEANVQTLISEDFKRRFPKYRTYAGYEISAPRPVESVIGRT
jgi:hypothetical protein